MPKSPKTCLKAILYLNVITLLFLSVSVQAAVFYIDYESGLDNNNGLSKEAPWKYCPGMDGWTGKHTPAPGDVFIFKGGVSWLLDLEGGACWNIGWSGTKDGGYITYTVDKTWFKGSRFSKPTIQPSKYFTKFSLLITGTLFSYVKIDGLRFANLGPGGVEPGGSRTMDFRSVQNVVITNCEFQPFASHGVVLSSGSGALRNIEVSYCLFHDAGNSIELGLQGGYGADNIEFHHNVITDASSMQVNNLHADGIQIMDTEGGNPLTNFKVYNNRFTGNWNSADGTTGFNALVFIQASGAKSPIIYNNIFDVQMSADNERTYGSIIFCQENDPQILNNTINMSNIANRGHLSIFRMVATTGGKIENNIVISAEHKIYWMVRNGIIDSINNNIYYKYGRDLAVVSTPYKTYYHVSWDEWRSLFGFDKNGYSQDPGINRETNILQKDSIAIDHGLSQKNLFQDDYDGTKRPQGEGWDIGAYEYVKKQVSLPAPLLMMVRGNILN